MLDFLGVTENFSVIEEVPFSMTWRFASAWNDEAQSLDGVTFDGRIYVGADREVVELDIAKGDESNVLVIGSIGLPEGRWPFEVFSTNDSGERLRMVSGYIGVIGSLEANRFRDEAPFADRTLKVRLPGDMSKQIKLEWMASSSAQMAAYSAWQAYEKIKGLDQGLGDAEKRLNDLNESANKTIERLDESKGLLDKAREEASNAHSAVDRLEDIIEGGTLNGAKGDTPSIGVNGNWWISGIDTGVKAEGVDGVTPHVGSNGNWFLGDADTGVSAIGQDGMDADLIRRIYIESDSDLPEEGSKGVFYYVPKQDGKYEVYAWVEYPDGDDAWTSISESAVTKATATNYGTARLATDNVTSGGAVGMNDKGQLHVVPASLNQHGSVQLSAGTLAGITGVIGVDAQGRAVTALATRTQAGVVKIDNVEQPSYKGAPLRIDANGVAYIPLASNTTYGVVARGTAMAVTPHERPYIVSLPVANDSTVLNSAARESTLTINLHRAGFLRYTDEGKAHNGGYQTGRYLWLDCGLGFDSEEYEGVIDGIRKTLHRLVVKRYADIVFHDSYASREKGGAIKVGSTMTITDGVLDVGMATGSRLGGIKVGHTLQMDESGGLNVVLDTVFNDKSNNPATAGAIAAWLAQKNLVSESGLSAKGFVTDAQVSAKYQPKMGWKDIKPMSQEEYERLTSTDSQILYVIY